MARESDFNWDDDLMTKWVNVWINIYYNTACYSGTNTGINKTE